MLATATKLSFVVQNFTINLTNLHDPFAPDEGGGGPVRHIRLVHVGRRGPVRRVQDGRR